MSSAYHMRQCTLEKRAEYGRRVTVSWIPERFAKKGRYVKLKSEDGGWTDGWKVTLVGARRSAREVHERARDHERHRKATDI